MDDNLFQANNKRKFDRNQLYYYLKVYHNKTNKLAGYVGDISPQGLMLFSKKSAKPDKVFNFRIDLDEGFGLDKKFIFEATSLRCDKDVNPEYYTIGFKFVDLEQESMDIVTYLIEKFGFIK
ncbi:MAG: PilZ domain-containing protein [Desulfobacteraceae bacterium]|nr:PilZ domain-containing protein [Desulfobacteraceae bacterium]